MPSIRRRLASPPYRCSPCRTVGIKLDDAFAVAEQIGVWSKGRSGHAGSAVDRQLLAKRGHGPVPAEAEEWSPATLHGEAGEDRSPHRVRRDFRRIDLLRPAALGMKNREQGQEVLP